MKVNLLDVRLGFGKGIFEKSAIGEGEPKYNCRPIIDPKDKKNVGAIEAAMLEVAKEKWKGEAEKVLAQLVKTKKVCFLKEDYCSTKTGEVFDGFEGMYSLSCSSDVKPLVIDRNKAPLSKDDGRPYSGCFVNLQVEIWAQDNKYGRRINAQLKGVQFVRDGDAFSGGTPANPDAFDDLGDQGDDAGDLA